MNDKRSKILFQFIIYHSMFLNHSKNFVLKNQIKNNSENKTFEKAREDIKSPKKALIICSVCSNHITDKSEKIKINESDNHTFVNPHGFVYNVECYKNAPGCMPIGELTDTFTWFKGYAWQISVCSKCLTHLGWKYQAGESGFYGLIKDLIIEKEEE
jgi:hypothetical protein